MKSYFDLEGDGGSRVAEQVEHRREAIRRRLAPLLVLAVGSGKGGVGKSTVTRLLALELKRRGRRPAILDVDFNGPAQARLSGLRSVVPVPGAEGLAVPKDGAGIGVLSLGSLVPEKESVEFDSVATGDSFTWRSTREFAALADLLAGTDWSDFDILLLDLPPGTEKTFQYAEFLGADCAFLLVSLPSSLSQGVVTRAVAALARIEAGVIGYVENMSGYWCSSCGSLQPLFENDPETAIDLPCLARLPLLPGLGEAGGTLSEIPTALHEELEKLCDNLLEPVPGGRR